MTALRFLSVAVLPVALAVSLWAAPAAPSTIVATGRPGSVLVQWSSVSGATDYRIEFKTAAASSWSTFADGVSTRQGTTVTGLVNNTAYDFRVSALDATGTSPASATLRRTPSATAHDPEVLRQILSTGQSLSTGSGGTPVLSTTQPYANRMLASGNGSLIPLVEPVPGASGSAETMSSALANTLSAQAGVEWRSLVSLHGLNGAAYSAVKKGTTPYANGQAQARAGLRLAVAEGRPFLVQALTVVHGESDEGADATPAQYRDYLQEWRADYQADASALTGQTGDLPLFLCQMSAWMRYAHTRPTTALGQLLAARENPGRIFLVTPRYLLDYSDQQHLKNHAYRRLGEYYGKVMERVFVDGVAWLPVSPRTLTLHGRVITARFHVPVPPLRFDTSAVLAARDLGFEYLDDSASAAIADVRITSSDTVAITLDRVPFGANPRLAYAAKGLPNTPAGRGVWSSARGNLRDSDATPATSVDAAMPPSLGSTLPNWCVTFLDPLAAGPAAPELAATSNGGQVALSWTATPGATGYALRRDGSTFATVSAATLTFTDPGPHALNAPLVYEVYALFADASFAASPALIVTPGHRAPAALVWQGSTGSGAWDAVTANWKRSGATDTFVGDDSVRFDDTAAAAAIRPAATLRPAALVFDHSTARAFTVEPSASASFDGPASLTKRGPGTTTLLPLAALSVRTGVALVAGQETVTVGNTSGLAAGMCVTTTTGALPYLATVAAVLDATRIVIHPAPVAASASTSLYFSTPNTQRGGTFIEAGTLALGSINANQHALGSGPVTLSGGTLSLYSAGSNLSGVFANDLIVPAATTGTLRAMQRGVLAGRLSGAGTLRLDLPFIRTEVSGDWSAFAGRLEATTASATQGDLRLAYGGDLPAATVDLATRVHAYYAPAVPVEGASLTLGALSGAAGSFLKGGPTATNRFTWRIGANGSDARFAGSVTEAAANAVTAIEKIGSGTWTLAGPATHAGPTTVSAGSLVLDNTTLAGSGLTVAGGATFIGSGTLSAPLTVATSGTATVPPGATLTATGSITNAGIFTVSPGATLAASGGFTNSGTLRLASSSQLPAGLVNTGTIEYLVPPVPKVLSFNLSAPTATLEIEAYPFWRFELQRTFTLQPAGWLSLGSPRNGIVGPLSFTDTIPSGTPHVFYRVAVTPFP